MIARRLMTAMAAFGLAGAAALASAPTASAHGAGHGTNPAPTGTRSLAAVRDGLAPFAGRR